ncbi:MAG: nitrous oxide reductase family maturation protein NosD [Pseudomonadales bacterium]|nr:nitrous oxide reductase family maturation protein NosD [Pseudomonadales bacterium]
MKTYRQWVAALVCLLASGSAVAGEWTVRAGQSIAATIALAQPGDLVRVERGYYQERLLIDKPLSLVGINRPTISAGNEGDAIRVTAEDVTIDGLIVRDSGDSLLDQNAGIYIRPGAHRATVRNCDLTYNLFGIYIEKVKTIEIHDNVITGKRDYKSPRRGNGIQLYNTEAAQIIGNEISFVRDGIYVDVSHHSVFRNNRIHNVRYGTHYMNSHNNVWEGNDSYHNRGGLALMMTRNQVVRNNRAWGNSDHGIMLRTIQDSLIEGNIVAGNTRGFFIYDAEYNIIRNNLVADNTIGVHLAAGSYHNQVEGNDFVANPTQI